MGEDTLIATLVQGGSMGGGFAVTLMAIRWAFSFAANRNDVREARIDEGNAKLLQNMEAQIANLTSRLEKAERAVDECKKQHIASEAEVAKLRMEIGVLTNG